MRKYKQEKNNTEYRGWCDSIKKRLEGYGIELEGELFTLASVKSIIGTEMTKDGLQKVYYKSPMTVPLSAIMRRRSKTHYMNVNHMVKDQHARYTEGLPAMSMSTSLFGVIGKLKHKDLEKSQI